MISSYLFYNKFLAAKKLPCNHIFHTSCLRSWFQRHQTCPTCRLDILHPTPLRPPMHRAAQGPHSHMRPTADFNRQGPYTGNLPPESQTGIRDNYEIPHNLKFRPFTLRQSASNNENNTNNNDPNLDERSGSGLGILSNEQLLELLSNTPLGGPENTVPHILGK